MKIYQTKDAELIAKLNQSVHELHVSLYPSYFKDYHAEKVKTFFEGLMNKEQYIFLVLEDIGQSIGFAMLELKAYPETIFKNAYQSLYIHQLSISSMYKSKGYGTKLMDEITTIARNKGLHKIELDHWSDNEIAKAFYKNLGYSPIREYLYKDI
ncbi:GNAT family N-acetyltransferase [Ornithinibacillus scapharcae]|uniref:GNAT family N-acetyltransferase n=1 Tax=Ornithinibacillus scapharcae TaxID=1147159 RepID=UPI000225BBB8|nr:GNAT family N-acetyltransferase [Ornithinibacillus scapharcae]